MQEKIIMGALISLLVVFIGGITYEIAVYDAEEEIVCRTNKPYGWNILEVNDGYFVAECSYINQPTITENCLSFRKTNAYERYGCQKAIVVINEVVTSQSNIGLTKCTAKGCTPWQ